MTFCRICIPLTIVLMLVLASAVYTIIYMDLRIAEKNIMIRDLWKLSNDCIDSFRNCVDTLKSCVETLEMWQP